MRLCLDAPTGKSARVGPLTELVKCARELVPTLYPLPPDVRLRSFPWGARGSLEPAG
jgi:hypothetical protein